MAVYVIPVVHVFETDDDPTHLWETFTTTLPDSAQFAGSPLVGTRDQLEDADWGVDVSYAAEPVTHYAEHEFDPRRLWRVVRWDAGDAVGTVCHETQSKAEEDARRKRKTHNGPMQSVEVIPPENKP